MMGAIDIVTTVRERSGFASFDLPPYGSRLGRNLLTGATVSVELGLSHDVLAAIRHRGAARGRVLIYDVFEVR